MIQLFFSFINAQNLPERTDFRMKASLRKPFSKEESDLKHTVDILIICLSLCVPSVYYGGLSAFLQIAVCLLSVTVSELIFMKLILKKNLFSDFSFISSALIIALLLPDDAPLSVSAIASVFSVAVCVFPFGSRLNTPFVPSAAAIAFALSAFKNDLSYGKDLSFLISEGEVMSLDFFSITDILSGALHGATGCSCILALIAAGIYLFIRKKESLIPSLGFILVVAAFALLFPRVNSGRLSSVFLELSAGSLLFTALLLINDPVTSPSKKLSRFIYGAFGGLITMLMRHFSPTLMPEVFSVLLMNAVLPAVTGETVNRKKALSRGKEKSSYEK